MDPVEPTSSPPSGDPVSTDPNAAQDPVEPTSSPPLGDPVSTDPNAAQDQHLRSGFRIEHQHGNVYKLVHESYFLFPPSSASENTASSGPAFMTSGERHSPPPPPYSPPTSIPAPWLSRFNSVDLPNNDIGADVRAAFDRIFGPDIQTDEPAGGDAPTSAPGAAQTSPTGANFGANDQQFFESLPPNYGQTLRVVNEATGSGFAQLPPPVELVGAPDQSIWGYMLPSSTENEDYYARLVFAREEFRTHYEERRSIIPQLGTESAGIRTERGRQEAMAIIAAASEQVMSTMDIIAEASHRFLATPTTRAEAEEDALLVPTQDQAEAQEETQKKVQEENVQEEEPQWFQGLCFLLGPIIMFFWFKMIYRFSIPVFFLVCRLFGMILYYAFTLLCRAWTWL
ncbi:hypothetical protein IQ07DRAFT_155828 [Pyrenochaeta sp. DS3sAY3a]|nr:hypothetical protein IQ07DRAFT_155828 [Pyrenochaeta sp. DS3sAY3a]